MEIFEINLVLKMIFIVLVITFRDTAMFFK